MVIHDASFWIGSFFGELLQLIVHVGRRKIDLFAGAMMKGIGLGVSQ